MQRARVSRRKVRRVQDRPFPGEGRIVWGDREESRSDAPPGMGGGGGGFVAALPAFRQAFSGHRLPRDRAPPDRRNRASGDGRGYQESDTPLCEAAIHLVFQRKRDRMASLSGRARCHSRKDRRFPGLTELERILEAIIFSSSKPITLKRLQKGLPEFTVLELQSAVSSLMTAHAASDRAVEIVEVSAAYQMRTRLG